MNIDTKQSGQGNAEPLDGLLTDPDFAAEIVRQLIEEENAPKQA